MYKCTNCGNEDRFYGVVKEQGNALIFQNSGCGMEPVPERHLAAVGAADSPSSPQDDSGSTVRGRMWALQNNGDGDEFTWAYFASEGSWKGFHEVRSCAICRSTDITFTQTN